MVIFYTLIVILFYIPSCWASDKVPTPNTDKSYEIAKKSAMDASVAANKEYLKRNNLSLSLKLIQWFSTRDTPSATQLAKGLQYTQYQINTIEYIDKQKGIAKSASSQMAVVENSTNTVIDAATPEETSSLVWLLQNDPYDHRYYFEYKK